MFAEAYRLVFGVVDSIGERIVHQVIVAGWCKPAAIGVEVVEGWTGGGVVDCLVWCTARIFVLGMVIARFVSGGKNVVGLWLCLS